MRYVAINTASSVIEIVVVFDDKFIAKRIEKKMAAEQLLPALDEILDTAQISLDMFDDFVCVVGPGSFTGIRIGVNTIRAFAYALKKNAYGVTFNRVLAYYYNGKSVAVVDGGNDVCYLAKYDDEATILEPICIYKKDINLYLTDGEKVVSDYQNDFSQLFVNDGVALKKAAEFAIKNKLGTDPLYIRKPQPERKEFDI